MFAKCRGAVELPLGTFRCDKCHQLLGTPVRQVNYIGTVCNICFDQKREKYTWHHLENLKLDRILDTLVLRCVHKGCSEEMSFGSLERHLKQCVHRPCLLNGCEWTGKLDGFVDHFKENHKSHIIPCEKDRKFPILISNEPSTVKLLIENGRLYFFTIWKEDDSMVFGMFEVDKSDETVDVLQINGSKITKDLKILPLCATSYAEGETLKCPKLPDLVGEETLSLVVGLKVPKID